MCSKAIYTILRVVISSFAILFKPGHNNSNANASKKKTAGQPTGLPPSGYSRS